MKTAVHQYEDKLLEFAYGELPAHEASAVEAHVRGCARCSQSLDEIRAVRATMAQVPPEPAPDAGLESLLAFAEAAAKRNAEALKPVPFWKKYLTPLVLVATLLTVGVVANQANREIDLSPAAAASDKKAEEYARADRRGPQKELKSMEEEAPTAAAPALAQRGDLAVTPAEEKQLAEVDTPGAGPQADRAGLAEALGTLGKRGAGEASGSVGMQSATRRDAAPKGGARLNDDDSAPMKPKAKKEVTATAAPPPPVAPSLAAPADKNVAGGYGLTGGAMTNDFGNASREVRSLEQEQKQKQNNKDDLDEARKAPAPIVAANEPSRTVAPAPDTAQAEAKPMPKTMPVKKSKSLSLGSRGEGRSSTADEEALSTLDAVGADGDARLAERQRAANATASLEQARTAAKQGDRKAEVAYAAQAVSQGAVGSARLEALTHLCNGYEALGLLDAADSWCDALLREFPDSSTARAISQRRGASQQYRAAPTQKATSQPAASEAAE